MYRTESPSGTRESLARRDPRTRPGWRGRKWSRCRCGWLTSLNHRDTEGTERIPIFVVSIILFIGFLRASESLWLILLMRTTWTFHSAGTLLFGRHAVRELGDIAKRLPARRCFIVA